MLLVTIAPVPPSMLYHSSEGRCQRLQNNDLKLIIRADASCSENNEAGLVARDGRRFSEIMMNFDHPNIVRLLGICTQDEAIYLITEVMKHGDLKAFIRNARPNETIIRALFSLSSNSWTSPLRLQPASLISPRVCSFIAILLHETVSSAKIIINCQSKFPTLE